MRRVAALSMHDVQHNDSAPHGYGAVQRRWSADRSCFAAPYGAQCECPFRLLPCLAYSIVVADGCRPRMRPVHNTTIQYSFNASHSCHYLVVGDGAKGICPSPKNGGKYFSDKYPVSCKIWACVNFSYTYWAKISSSRPPPKVYLSS